MYERNGSLQHCSQNFLYKIFDYFNTVLHRSFLASVGSRATPYHPAAEDFVALHKSTFY